MFPLPRLLSYYPQNPLLLVQWAYIYGQRDLSAYSESNIVTKNRRRTSVNMFRIEFCLVSSSTAE